MGIASAFRLRSASYGGQVALPILRPVERATFGAAVMLRVPLWPGPSHVVKLRPIGIAGNLDKPVPPRQPVGWVKPFAKPIIFADFKLMGIALLHPSYGPARTRNA
jgi:hypothetical protein